MKRFVIEQSDKEFYTSHSGLALVGLALNRFTSLSSAFAAMDAPADLISGIDIRSELLRPSCTGQERFRCRWAVPERLLLPGSTRQLEPEFFRKTFAGQVGFRV